jgi:hypothetical protein
MHAATDQHFDSTSMRRSSRFVVLTGFVLAGSALSNLAQSAQQLGIVQDHLSQQAAPVQQKILDDIQSLHVTWFRDGPSSGSAQGAANFVDEVRLVKERNLRMLVNIVQVDGDYDGALSTNRCGWKEKRLSAINLDKYAQRLRNLFGALKAANLTIDAVEFGNEDDQYCYDADVPQGHAGSPSQEELRTWLRGYGRFLQTGAETLHSFFPEAKLVTFGLAHSGNYRSDDSFPKPARMVAMLRNVDGFNYLDNSGYHVDGFGTHLYPSPNDVQSAGQTLHEDEAALGNGKPFWVTEWGFLRMGDFPNRKGQTLGQAMQELLGTFDVIGRNTALGPLMFYRYSGWLADGPGHLLPQASVLAGQAGRH